MATRGFKFCTQAPRAHPVRTMRGNAHLRDQALDLALRHDVIEAQVNNNALPFFPLFIEPLAVARAAPALSRHPLPLLLLGALPFGRRLVRVCCTRAVELALFLALRRLRADSTVTTGGRQRGAQR
jgi:hypothetical protein